MHTVSNEVGIWSSLPFETALVEPPQTTTCINAELVFTQGAPADTVYRVCQGAVIEYRLMSDTNERQILSVIHEGGFAGVTGSNYYDTTGEALTGTRLEPISRSCFVGMLLHEPGFAESLRQHLSAAISGFPVIQSNKSAHAEIRDWEQPDFFDESDDNLLARVAKAILEGESRCPHVGSAVSISPSSMNVTECALVDHQAFHRCLLVLRWRQLISFSNPAFIDILDRPGLHRLAGGSNVMNS